MIFDIIKDVVLLGSSKGRLEREVKGLRKFIDPKALIPWGEEELTLLSLQLEHKTKKSLFNTVTSGFFKTIYAESVIAYAYKDVYTGTKRGLVLGKTLKHEYVYRLTQGIAQVYLDGSAIGIIDHHGRLLNNRRTKMLGMIEQAPGNSLDISIGDTKIGRFNKPSANAALHERAMHIFKEMGNSDQQIVVSLVIFEILKRNV